MDKPMLAREAQQVIDSPAFTEAFQRFEAEIVRRLAECPMDGSDDAYRDKLHMMLKLHYRYRHIFTEMIASGKLEDRRIDRKTLRNRQGM